MLTDEDTNPVNPDKWESMTYSELVEQKTILMDRYYYALSISASYAKAILEGINRIDTYLDKLSI